jgi:hypothetical protein
MKRLQSAEFVISQFDNFCKMPADSFQHPDNPALQVKYIRTEPLLFLRSLSSNPSTALSNSCSGDEQILTQTKIKIAPVFRFFTHVGIEGKKINVLIHVPWSLLLLISM